MQRRPLDGIRVLDFTWVRAGPWAAHWLAALGAEVIKVEWLQPGAGTFNGRGAAAGDGGAPPPPGIPQGFNSGGNFNDTNAGKLGVTLNVRSPRGLELTKRLLAMSDIVIENFSSRVMANWGLSYEEMAAIKPDLVYVSMAGLGHIGRRAPGDLPSRLSALPGTGLRPAQGAESEADHVLADGFRPDRSLAGLPGLGSTAPGRGRADGRLRLQRGGHPERAAHRSGGRECLAHGLPLRLHRHSGRGEPPGLHGQGPVHRYLRPRSLRPDHRRPLCELGLQQAGRAAQHRPARLHFVEIEYPELGRTVTHPVGGAIFNASPVRISRRAPLIGEHNREVYQELGVEGAQLPVLREAGVI